MNKYNKPKGLQGLHLRKSSVGALVAKFENGGRLDDDSPHSQEPNQEPSQEPSREPIRQPTKSMETPQPTKVQKHEIGEVVALDADSNTVTTPFVDLNNLRPEVSERTRVHIPILQDAGYSVSTFEEAKEDTAHHINVLILGETGTGKSTFINSIVNYYLYDSFDDARKNELFVPVSASINLWDKAGVEHTFRVGTADEDEIEKVGAACTQLVKIYYFPADDDGSILRIIDTPGMGDPRGVMKDDETCESILALLSEYETLHAICFLVKSNNSRITVLFEYCLKQILSRLDKSASNNIIFIFTNTVSDYYKGGNTYSLLREMIKMIQKNQPEVNINFDRNLFYLDNEAFRILAALHNGIDVHDRVITSATESWDQSATECKRLKSYIKGDGSNPPLPPHQLKHTISINEARRLIDNISEPLANISDSVKDNIRMLEDHQKKLKLDCEDLEYMKKNLYIPVVKLRAEPLTQPMTVCASDKCLEYIQIEDKKLSHYKQRCHEPCFKHKIPPLHIGHPALRDCAAMGGQANCQKCGCHFTSHMHVYQLTSKYDDRIIDKITVENIQTKEEAVNATKELMKQLHDRQVLLEKEQDAIMEATAMFAHFVQHNAITPFNDSYKSYVEHQIVRERSRGTDANQREITDLQELLKMYDLKKANFDETLNLRGPNADQDRVTAETVVTYMSALRNLKFSGEALTKLTDVTSKCRQIEYKAAFKVLDALKKTFNSVKNKFGLGRK